MKTARALTCVGLVFLPACGAILDLPDPTVDNGFGQGTGSDSGLLADGAYADGFVPPGDGSVGGDGSSGNDGSAFDGGPACGATPSCFGGACVSGVCQPVQIYTAAALDPTVIDSDGTDVYFVSGTQVVDKVNPETRALTTLASSEGNLADLKVVGAKVYFSNGGFGTGAGTITSCPTSGCSSGRIDYVKMSSLPFFGIAADATNVYFTEDQAAGGIYKCPIGSAGCTPTSISPSASAHSLLELSGMLFWDDDSSSKNGVFQCTATSCTKTGGADDTFIVDIAVTAGDIFWANQTKVSVRDRSTSAKTQIVINRTNVVAVAADATNVYWLDANGGTAGLLQKCNIAAGCTVNPANVVTMATAIKGAADLVVTSDSVFYTAADDNAVWRVAK